MAEINEYLSKTVTLGDNVNDVSQLLNKSNDNIQKLTRELEVLFAHFSRGDELIKIIHDYSKNLQQDILNLKDLYSKYEIMMEDINDQLLANGELLRSLIQMLQQIQNNADIFVKSAQLLANLAKNTEICAHHARREGKGLAIIAKECLSLAKLAQLPFKNFSTLLNNLEQITKPVILELNKTIELSLRARGLLTKSFRSLKTIDDTTASLQKIITQLEGNNVVNNQLKSGVSEGLDVLKEQLLISLNTIDEISIHCMQVNSLAQTLSALSEIILAVKEQDSHLADSLDIAYIEKQYNFYLQENIRTIGKFSSSKKPPLFPRKIYNSINNMTEQIDGLYNSLKEIHEYKEKLGTDMNDVINLGMQIEDFFKEIENIHRRFNDLGKNLNSEIVKIEDLVSATGKIFNRIKTLSVFAKIEEGRSIIFKDIISPIVGEFVQLEEDTERAFASIIPQLTLVKKDSHTLAKEWTITYPRKIRPPDYSKIKIFLDDISRVFGEEKKQAAEISTIVKGVDKEDSNLAHAWHTYEEIIRQIIELSNTLKKLFVHEQVQAPAYIKAKRILTASLPSEPLTLKPDLKTDVNSHQVICNCSSGLFQFGSGADIIPGLCHDYSVSKDGKEYIFKLRDDLKYHNGRPIHIEHIKESILKALRGPNCSSYDMISGASGFIEEKTGPDLGIEIIDKFSLKVNLEYPFRPFLANLACNIVDPYIDDELPVGAGPFKIVAWEKGDRIVLEANDHYFEGRPAVDELYFLIIKDESLGYELFQNHSLSIFQPTGESLKKIRTEMPKSLHTIPELSIQYLCINCQKEPFSNRMVRQALAHAINIDEFIDTFLKGSAIKAKGFFPPSMKVFNRHLEGYKFDPERSRSLLADAGFPNGLPGTHTFDVSDALEIMHRAEYIKESLMKIGVRIDINPMSWHNMIEKSYAGDSTLSFRGWVSDNGDPDNFVYPLFHTSSRGRSGNTFFFSSQDIDHDIDQARKMRNFNQRINLYQKIEKKILDETPGIFLYHRLQNLAVQSDVLGIKPHPLGLVRAKSVCPTGKRWLVLPQPTHREKEIVNMVYAKP